MVKIKYYVTYGSWNQELMGKGGEAIQKAMEKWTKTVEEAGLKMVFWGSPYGVSENAIVVTKGAVDDYVKLAPLPSPYTASRTNMVLTF
jgi:hypothetical protein